MLSSAAPSHAPQRRYPRGWVGRPNSLRPGLNISDFSSSDKLSVEILNITPAAATDLDELIRLAILATIVPGSQQVGRVGSSLMGVLCVRA